MRLNKRRIKVANLLKFYIRNHGLYCPVSVTFGTGKTWNEVRRHCLYNHVDCLKPIKRTEHKLKRL